MKISVKLFGDYGVWINENRVSFPFKKSEGLFYYLATKGNISKDEAIGIFWIDCAEENAKKNLRDALYHLRKIFGNNIICTEGNKRIYIDRSLISEIDFDEITDENLPEQYQEEFLNFFYIKNCDEFEDWLSEMRSDLQSRYMNIIKNRIRTAGEGGNIQSILDCASLLMRKKILDEEVYREVFSFLLSHGAYSEADRIYSKLCDMLAAELDAEPEEETQEIFKQLNLIKFDLSTKTSTVSTQSNFFHRENEILIIKDNILSLGRGEFARSLFIGGEIGVGKSTIIKNIIEWADQEEYLVLNCQCVKTEKNLYLKTWLDIMAQMPKSNLLPQKPLNEFSSRQNPDLINTQYEIYIKSAISSYIQNSNKKILLFIDDIQWLDNASKSLLCNLILWDNNKNFILIASARNDANKDIIDIKIPLLAQNLAKEVNVRRFTAEEAKDIIANMAPHLCEDEVNLEKIYHHTAGNALFLFEFIKGSHHASQMENLSERTIGMIQTRLLALTAEARSLLDFISLFPRFATLEDIQVFTEISTIQSISNLEMLLDSGLISLNTIHDKSGYGFSHLIIRNYIYKNLLGDKKLFMHRLIAEQYEKIYAQENDNRYLPVLIYHYENSDVKTKALSYRLEYFSTFYDLEHEIYPSTLYAYSFVANSNQYENREKELEELASEIRALKLGSLITDTIRMKLEFLIGRYLLFCGDYERALESIGISILLAKKHKQGKYLLDNYLQLVYHAILIYDLDRFDENLTACEELSEQYFFSEIDTCTIIRLRGLYNMKILKYDEAELCFNKTIEKLTLIRKMDSSCSVGLAACYNYLGEIWHILGYPNQAKEHFLKAINCCDNSEFSGLIVFYSNLAYANYSLENLEEAETFINKSLSLIEKSGSRWGYFKAKIYAALIAIKQNDIEKAKAYFLSIKDSTPEIADPSTVKLVKDLIVKFDNI